MSAEPRAERFWSQVLLAYPGWYRRERAEEMLGVLMAAETRPSTGEAASLVRHGLAVRLLGRRRGQWRSPAAAATVLLACVVGVMGAQIALLAAQSWWHQQHPDPTMVWYVDPLWPVGAAWLAVLVLVLLRQGWAALLVAWAAVALAVAVLAGSSDASLGNAYDLTSGYQSVAFLLPSLVLALLLTRPARVRHGIELLGYRSLALVLAAAAAVRLLGGSEQALPLTAVVVALLVLYRHEQLMRGGICLLVGFAWLGLLPLADGSGSRLPHDPVALSASLAVIPLLVLGAVLLAVRNIESDGFVRRGLVALTESLAGAARRTGSGGGRR